MPNSILTQNIVIKKGRSEIWIIGISKFPHKIIHKALSFGEGMGEASFVEGKSEAFL